MRPSNFPALMGIGETRCNLTGKELGHQGLFLALPDRYLDDDVVGQLRELGVVRHHRRLADRETAGLNNGHPARLTPQGGSRHY